MIQLPSWSLPLIVACLVVPIIGAFMLAGPALGLAVGALAAAAVVAVAAAKPPKGAIGARAGPDASPRVLVTLSRPVESEGAVERIAAAAGADEGADGQILVLAPARSRFLDRWASDTRRANAEAQRDLVISVASLARADLDARARVGDADLVQAVADSLASFPATRVILATGPPSEDHEGSAAAGELERRLEVPFTHLVLD